MRQARIQFQAFLLLILTVLAGCDNVEWGGAEFAIVPPPPKPSAPGEGAADGEIEPLPEGRVLYYVRTTDAGATLMPVGEVTGDGMEAIEPGDWERYGERFIAEHLRRGTEFALYHRGARVGTFVARSAEVPSAAVCPRLPQAEGTVELSAGIEEPPTEFIALAKPGAPQPERETPVAAQPTRNMQVVAPILAERLIRARSASLPGNWSRARAQLFTFPAGDVPAPAFATTFLVDDTLGVGLDATGYSLFFIGAPNERAGYDTTFVRFTSYPESGKAAPRVIDFLDWNSDGAAELLLEVYGTDNRWFAALGMQDDEWRLLLEQRCQELRPTAAAPPDENE